MIDRFLEDLRLDGGVADQRGLNSREEVAGVASLDFGEDLGIRVVVEEVELPVAPDKGAALLPAGKFRDEEVGTGEFDIDVE